MKKDTHKPQPLKINEGYFIDQQYDNYEMMQANITNWKQLCPYQLRPDSLSGRLQILHLHLMQIVFGKRNGGTMHYAGSPKDSLNIALVESCEDKGCFGRIKIKTGDIFFFDDTHPNNFIANHTVKFIVISIDKNNLGSRLSSLSKVLDHRIYDTDAHLRTMLREIWKRFTASSSKVDTQSYQKAEEQILSTVMELLADQTPVIPKLTNGEKIALDIRDQVMHHLDGKISISSLAKQHNITEQTLQNSFKSLFGFTPKKFLHQLKLNLVHHELQKDNPKQNTVSKIAFKWGFEHMGHFSSYYTELFGVNPSQTLKTPYQIEDDIEALCVTRKEMM
ncbi:MAG: AraC family transcriptional regulator [Sulfurovum sp.]|nr:AraC family transcriptional regulator [Sulfurovum sp.]